MSEEYKDPIIYSDEVKKTMEDDSDMAEIVRIFAAAARQAMEGVKSGQYATFEDAMEKLTGSRPEPVTDEDMEDLMEDES